MSKHHQITPSFFIVRKPDSLKVFINLRKPILMCAGQITKDTAQALRVLADEIESEAEQV